MKNLFTFFAYNNTVPIALGVLFLGAGGALAASPAVQQSVYSSQQVVQSIDNTRIVSADIPNLPLTVKVTGVTEDAVSYFIAYTLSTISLVEGVWKDIDQQRILSVPKSALRNEDLGVYASRQLAEVRDAERDTLQRTQEVEQRNGVSQKVIATVYGGLVGQLLDPTTETFPGYTPVVTPEQGTVPLGMAVPGANPADSAPNLELQIAGQPVPGDRAAPSIQILGNNPARIETKTVYADLGVLVTDNTMQNIGYTVTVDGVQAPQNLVMIDTTVPGVHTIVYTATDVSGNTGTATRTVEIFDPFPDNAATSTQP